VPMTTSRPEPFALGLRFTDEPDDVYRCVVAPGAPAEGSSVADLDIGDDAWVNMIRRDGRLLQIRGTTILQEGDELLVQTDPDVDLRGLFRSPSTNTD
jgi:cell volume regulation protein A